MTTNLKSILQLEVPIIVQVAARKMSVREVANLAPGAIIELPKLAEDELELLVSNRTIGSGRAVKVGENFGLRVSFVGDLEARINAMGGQNSDALPPAESDGGGAGDEDAVTNAMVDEILSGQSKGSEAA